MFLKPKHDGMGVFDKLKGRIVANGAQQNRYDDDDTSSPTAMLQSVMMCLTITAHERRRIAALDIGGAYLHAEMPHGEGDTPVIMTLDPTLTKMLMEVDLRVIPFVNRKGILYVQLQKALYGCVQSARLWYNRLTQFLRGRGFTHNPVDPCVVNKTVEGAQITLIQYVDDVLVLTKLKDHICWIESELKGELVKSRAVMI